MELASYLSAWKILIITLFCTTLKYSPLIQLQHSFSFFGPHKLQNLCHSLCQCSTSRTCIAFVGHRKSVSCFLLGYHSHFLHIGSTYTRFHLSYNAHQTRMWRMWHELNRNDIKTACFYCCYKLRNNMYFFSKVVRVRVHWCNFRTTLHHRILSVFWTLFITDLHFCVVNCIKNSWYLVLNLVTEKVYFSPEKLITLFCGKIFFCRGFLLILLQASVSMVCILWRKLFQIIAQNWYADSS